MSLQDRLNRAVKCADKVQDGCCHKEMAGLKAEIERLRIQCDVYRVIIEAATMASVDMVSAAKMREKFVGIRERESELMAENERLRKVIAEHELCHEEGEVTPDCFAKSCIAYQQKKFGRSPTQDELALTYDLLGQVYEQIGNHRPPEIRHVVTPKLRDEIHDYLDSKGYWDNP